MCNSTVCNCKGLKGKVGAIGVPGVPGVEGLSGDHGPTGPQGRPGEEGDHGVYGAIGEKGLRVSFNISILFHIINDHLQFRATKDSQDQLVSQDTMVCTEFKDPEDLTELMDAMVLMVPQALLDILEDMVPGVCRVCPESKDLAERLARVASTRKETRETVVTLESTALMVKWDILARRDPRDTKDWLGSM